MGHLKMLTEVDLKAATFRNTNGIQLKTDSSLKMQTKPLPKKIALPKHRPLHLNSRKLLRNFHPLNSDVVRVLKREPRTGKPQNKKSQ